jgi:general secretion pathway protein C
MRLLPAMLVFIAAVACGEEPSPSMSLSTSTSTSLSSSTATSTAAATALSPVSFPRARRAAILASPERHLRDARIVPSVIDGRLVGYRLFAILPGTPFAELGLQNGDTIRAIDDHPLTPPDEAAALVALASADRFTLHLTRQGQPHTLEVTLP